MRRILTLMLVAGFAAGCVQTPPELQAVSAAADALLATLAQEGYRLPMRGKYPWGSNADVLGNVPFTRTDLTILRLGADANYRDNWNGVTFGNLRLSKGIDAFGATNKGDPLLTFEDGQATLRALMSSPS